MCENHQFLFDVDKAYADQLLAAFEASPSHPLRDPEAPRAIGVYALYRGRRRMPVYVGEALGTDGVRGRLRDHRGKIDGRRRIALDEMTCKFLVIRQKWEVARAESVLIENYGPHWNGMPGFAMHVPGGGRPGMPGYINEWERRFPPLR